MTFFVITQRVEPSAVTSDPRGSRILWNDCFASEDRARRTAETYNRHAGNGVSYGYLAYDDRETMDAIAARI